MVLAVCDLRSRVTFVRRGGIFALLLCAGVAMTRPALAESPCELRFEGTAVPEAWSEAMHDVRALVGKLTPATTDCRVVAVAPDGDGATIVFTTADGRRARRHIAEPRELLPMVEALLVFGRDPPLAGFDHAPAEPETCRPPAPALARAELPEGSPLEPAEATRLDALDAREARDAKPRDRTKDSPRVLVGAGAGVKESWPRDAPAAVGQIFAGMSLAHWELAGFARWEIEHDVQKDASSGELKYSALGGGAMLGRREELGPMVVFGGARAALYDAEQERSGQRDERRTGRVHESFLDPRFGLYAGCIAFESSRVRLRVEVDGDAGLAQHRAELADLPAFPRWSLGISLGAEAGFLP